MKTKYLVSYSYVTGVGLGDTIAESIGRFTVEAESEVAAGGIGENLKANVIGARA